MAKFGELVNASGNGKLRTEDGVTDDFMTERVANYRLDPIESLSDEQEQLHT